MAGLTLTLETAKDTLLNSQVAIQTSSHNISNADNATYSRQVVSFATNPAIRIGSGYLGTGAHAASITQMRDGYVEQKLSDATSQESMYKTLLSRLQSVQASVADDGSTGISQAMGAFWSAWNTASSNPAGQTEQTGVYQSANNLVNTISNAYQSLKSTADTDLPKAIGDDVTKVNSLLSQLADYNQQIMKNETPGHPANDLRDARYGVMQQLSALVPTKFTEDAATGAVTATMNDGGTAVTLVSGSMSGSLQYSASTHLLSYTQADGTSVTPAANSVSGGEIGGLLTASSDVESYIQKLNDFTGALITQVNSIHTQGGGPSVFSGTDASNIAVVSGFMSGQDPATEASRALQISQLQDATVSFGATPVSSTFSGYISGFQQQIGLDEQNASTQADFNSTLVSNLTAQQQSVSGVSIDEETVDMLKYQQIYQAAAKIVSMAADMLKTVIDMA